MKMRIRFSIIKIFEYILFALIILNCNTVYSTALKDYYFPELIALSLIVLAAVVFFTLKITKAVLKKWVIVMSPFFAIGVVYLLVGVSLDQMLKYSIRYLIFLPVLTLLIAIYNDNDKLYDFFAVFSNLMVIEAAISIFFWLFGSQLNVIKPNMSITSFWGVEYPYSGYNGLYFERQTGSFLFLNGIRNMGFFAEAPMHSLCLVMAITLLFVVEDEESIKSPPKIWHKKAILLIAVFTTYSTTGILLCIGIIFYRFLTKRSRHKVIKYVFIVLFSIICALAAYNIFIEKSVSGSWMTRVDDFKAGLHAWLDAPLFGNGFGTRAHLKYFSGFRISNTGFSNSIFSILSQGGIWLFTIYVFPLLMQLSFLIKYRRWNLLLFNIVLIIEFVVTIFTNTFLLFFFLAILFSLSVSKYKKEYSSKKARMI